MGPIAAKVLREIRKATRNQVVDLRVMRELRELSQANADEPQDAADLPPHHVEWMAAFKLLATFAHPLLAMSPLRKLADRVASAEDEFMPGGPPMSPILDSVFTTWVLADATVGPRRETLCSIIVDLAPALNFAAPLTAAARSLAASHSGIYEVSALESDRVELTDLFSARRVQARVPKDMSTRGPLWLTRLLPPLSGEDGDWVVWTTPYRLDGPRAIDAWRAYGERVAAGAPEPERAKRLFARFKAADQPRRWLMYIMDGYAGVSPDGVVVLTGIEDMPHTLPHHASYSPADAYDLEHKASPLERVRLQLLHFADEEGFPVERAAIEADHPLRTMELAYRMYGQLDEDGKSVLELFAEDGAALPESERRMLDALRAGWFSVFEVQRVKVDEGMQLRDALTKQSLWITEKSATRQLQLGDLLFGWLTVEPDATRLEGAVGHVPARLAKPFLSDIRKGLAALRRTQPQLDWKKQHGRLALRAIERVGQILAEAPAPQIVNADGHDIVLSEAHYELTDPQRVRSLLAGAFEPGDDSNTFAWSVDDSVRGVIALNGAKLSAQTNSRERLAELKARLSARLHGCIVHRADTHEDPVAAARRAVPAGAATPRKPAPALPPEVAEQVQAMLLERMRHWIDEPIPMLGGQSPRQAVRTERGRDDVTLMLIQQQQMFDAGAGMPKIDLSDVWRSLGLAPRV